MPPLNLWGKFINGMYNKFSKDMGNSLIMMGVVGWVFSAAAQIGMIVFSKHIDKKEKKFLVPQEIADGVINIGLNVTICKAVKWLGDTLLEKGAFVTHRTNQLFRMFGEGQSTKANVLKFFSECLVDERVLSPKCEGKHVSNFYEGLIKVLSNGVEASLKEDGLARKSLENLGIIDKSQKHLDLLKKGFQDYNGFKNGVGVIAAIGGSVLAASVITPFARNKAANYFQKRAIDRGKVPLPKTSPPAVGLKPYPIPISNTFKGFGI